MKKGYFDNIEQSTVDNTDFRRVLYTGANLQLVLMCLQPGEEIAFTTPAVDLIQMVGRYMFSGPGGSDDTPAQPAPADDIFAPEPLPSPEEPNP